MCVYARTQGSEWKEKTEKLEIELQQCYKAQSRLSEQLVIEVAESRTSKASLQEKELLINDMETELTETRSDCGFISKCLLTELISIVRFLKTRIGICREKCTQLEEELDEKSKTLDLLIAENKEVRSQLEEMADRAQKAESENKMLIDRWMLQKMQDAERLNEVNMGGTFFSFG